MSRTHARTTPLTFALASIAGLAFITPSIHAAVFSSAATGNYNANATWGAASNPATSGDPADTVSINNTHTVTVSAISQTSGDTITINSGGILTSTVNGAIYSGATLQLNGGVLRHVRNGSSAVSGNVVVAANSSIENLRASGGNNTQDLTFASLNFSAPNTTLSLSSNNTSSAPGSIVVFGASNLSNDGTITMTGAQVIAARIDGLTLASNRTLSKDGFGTLTITGNNSALAGTLNIISGKIDALGGAAVAEGSFNDILGTASVTIRTGGTLSTQLRSSNGFLNGNTITLDGGTFQYDNNNHAPSTIAPGGNFFVTANGGTFVSMRTGGDNSVAHAYGSLSFLAAGATLLVRGGDSTDITQRSIFTGSTITHSATVDVRDSNATASVSNAALSFSNTKVAPGATISYISSASGSGNAADANLTVSGTLGVKLTGSADILTSTTFTLFDGSTAAGSFTKSFTFQSSDGLWTSGGAAKTITATLGNLKDTITVADSASFAAENAGYVDFTGLVSGTEYVITLDLANFTTNIAGVINELSKNTAFTDLAASDANTLSFHWISTLNGTAHFAWDNVDPLGADVTFVSLQLDSPEVPIPEPMSLSLLALGTLAFTFKRRK